MQRGSSFQNHMLADGNHEKRNNHSTVRAVDNTQPTNKDMYGWLTWRPCEVEKLSMHIMSPFFHVLQGKEPC